MVCNDSRNNTLFPNKWLKLKLLQILCRASPWMVGEMHIFSFDYVCSFKLSEREIHFYRNWGTGFALLNNFSGWVPKKKVRLYQDCPPLWICIDCKVSFILYSWLIDNWWQWMNVWNGGVGFQIHFMELLKNIDVKLWKPFGYFSWMIVYWIDLNLVHLDHFDKLSWNINTAISQLCTMSFVMPGALITKQRDLVLWHWLFFFFYQFNITITTLDLRSLSPQGKHSE